MRSPQRSARPTPARSRSALRDSRRLDREGMAWSKALAYPIRAGVAAARGDTSRAASLFAEAVDSARGRRHESLRRRITPPPGRDPRGR